MTGDDKAAEIERVARLAMRFSPGQGLVTVEQIADIHGYEVYSATENLSWLSQFITICAHEGRIWRINASFESAEAFLIEVGFPLDNEWFPELFTRYLLTPGWYIVDIPPGWSVTKRSEYGFHEPRLEDGKFVMFCANRLEGEYYYRITIDSEYHITVEKWCFVCPEASSEYRRSMWSPYANRIPQDDKAAEIESGPRLAPGFSSGEGLVTIEQIANIHGYEVYYSTDSNWPKSPVTICAHDGKTWWVNESFEAAEEFLVKVRFPLDDAWFSELFTRYLKPNNWWVSRTPQKFDGWHVPRLEDGKFVMFCGHRNRYHSKNYHRVTVDSDYHITVEILLHRYSDLEPEE